MKGLIPNSAGWYDASGAVQGASADAPLPTASYPLKLTYSGTLANGQTARMHGGAAGTPTVQNAIRYRYVQIYLQHRMATASQSGNTLSVRRRATDAQGNAYTEWTSAASFNFDSTTTDSTAVFRIAAVTDSASPIADEYEVSLTNASATSNNNLVWQAVVHLIP